MPVAFRVDAGPELGSGHLVRCRRLARALREEGFSSEFVSTTASGPLFAELKQEGFVTHSIPANNSANPRGILDVLNENSEAYLVVVDSYAQQFHSNEFQEQLPSSSSPWMMITRSDAPCYRSDIIHNQNLMALQHEYTCSDHTTTLLGPEYAILDSQYRKLRLSSPQTTNSPDTVLVTLGGSDPRRQTPRVVKQLAELSNYLQRVIIVAGGLYPKLNELKDLLTELSLKSNLHVNTSRMPELMSECDFAITSGGMTTWELACLGKPNLILSLTDAQRRFAKFLDENGYALHLGHWEQLKSAELKTGIIGFLRNHSLRKKLAARTHKLVDGRGTRRVVNTIIDHLTD